MSLGDEGNWNRCRSGGTIAHSPIIAKTGLPDRIGPLRETVSVRAQAGYCQSGLARYLRGASRLSGVVEFLRFDLVFDFRYWQVDLCG